jgi:hypothetical protein
MKVSLTELVDVVARAGSPKATRVAQIKARSFDEYRPFKDFYKSLREVLVATHKCGEAKNALDTRLENVHEPTRRRRYDELIRQYKAWWGRKNIEWFPAPTATYTGSGVSVSVNPELGMDFGGHRYVVKLYFKAEPLKRSSADLITGLMALALDGQGDEKFAVLDIQRGKLFLREGRPSDVLVAVIDAELAYIAHIWPSLGNAA